MGRWREFLDEQGLLKKYPSLIYSLLIKNDKKCKDIYMTWGHMVDLKTRWHLFPFTKTKHPSQINKRRDRNVTGRIASSRKQLIIQPTSGPASRRSTLKNFWKAPCASMAQPSTLACRWSLSYLVGRLFLGVRWQFVRAFFLGGTRCDRNVEAKLVDDKRVGLLRHLVCNYLGVERSTLAERMRWCDLECQGWFFRKGTFGRRFHHDVRGPPIPATRHFSEA